MARWLIGLTLGLCVGGAGVIFGLLPIGAAFEQGVGLPWLFHVRGPVRSPDGVAVVAMDGRTGEALGLPPLPRDWPRSIHAQLVDNLVARGASLIAFDVHFGQPKDPASDRAFVDAVTRAGNVVTVELLTGKRQPIADRSGRHVGTIWEEESQPPFQPLSTAVKGLASFPLPKAGASVSQFWVFKESADEAPTLPAVALQLRARGELPALIDRARTLAPIEGAALPDPERIFSDPTQLRHSMRELRSFFERLPQTAPVSDAAAADNPNTLQAALEALYRGPAHRFLNIYGPPGSIATVPYQSVIQGTDPNLDDKALDFTGKAVFVGYSDLFDPGQPDRFYTVFTRDDGVDLSGVEIAATAYANLLTDRSLTPVDPRVFVALLILFGIAAGTAVYVLPGHLGVSVALALAASYAVAAQYQFDSRGVVLPVAIPLLAQAPVALFAGLLGQYLIERRRGQRMGKAITNYLPDAIVRDLARNKLDPGKLNQVVYGTCLATDMAGFSTIAEKLAPGELAKFLNDYFETLAAPLKEHKVHVTEFRADAIMCAWIDERPSANPRRQALLAALDAADAIKDFQKRHDMPGAKLRIGLETGRIYVGHAGGGGRFVYSIVGDSANTASRVEGLNKHVGTQILATGAVVSGFENLVTRYLGDFQFVGKTEALPIYEVLTKRETATDRQLLLCESFDSAMSPHWEGSWFEASSLLEEFLEDFPDDGPARFFLERSRRFSNEPEQASNPRVIRMDAK